MNVKLIITDIDGTLVNSKKELLPETKQAINKFIDCGGIFAIASGRPTKGIQKYIDELDLKNKGGYVISYNGSRITELKTGKIIYQNNINPDQMEDIINETEKIGVPLTTYKDGVAITQIADDKYFELEIGINSLDVIRVESLREELKYPVPKFLITGDPEKIEQAEIHLSQSLKGVTVFRSEPFFLEIAPSNVNKGVAVNELGKYLGIKNEEIMACGDGYNDVVLIEEAGIGVAMKNAQKPVLEIADYITDSNENDGVGKAINKLAF